MIKGTTKKARENALKLVDSMIDPNGRCDWDPDTGTCRRG